jgi:glycosyltransferase involved in cell wall biosynthesis
MACRCPLVSTPAGRPAEIIENGFNGYLAEGVEGLAQGLYDVVMASNWEQVSANARESVSGYTWDDATILFEKALKAAIADALSSRKVI